MRFGKWEMSVPRSVKHWSLTTLREKMIKIGAKVVRHAKYVTFQMAETVVSGRFASSVLGFRRRCCSADECRNWVKNMMILDKGWLLCAA